METFENIIEELQAKGYRLTEARQALLEVLFRDSAPLSVPEILERMGRRGTVVNKTTVYRELENLERLGVVRNVQLSDRRQHYEIASREHHHHLVCIDCEQVEDIEVDEQDIARQEDIVRQKNRFTVLRHSLEFFGLCRNCRS